MQYQKPLELTIGDKPECSVIWLHGLGADGNDFVPVAEMLHLPVGVRFLFPHAPMAPVSVNNGYVMPAWYDIYGMDLAAKVDVQGIRRSVEYLQTLVERENRRGITTGRIVLAGFSQGGLIALATAFELQDKPLGVMALSTYLPQQWPLGPQTGLEVFQAHGRHDPVVPFAAALAARRRLEERQCRVTWREYAMEHSVLPEEINDISAWLAARLA